MATPNCTTTLASEVLRENRSELYQILIRSDTCRNIVATDLYSKNIVSEHEHDKIKRLALLEPGIATDEILQRIEIAVKVLPSKVNEVLEILERQEILKPTVALMRKKLSDAVLTDDSQGTKQGISKEHND